MKKSVLLLFFAGCVATGIFGIGRKIPMNRVNDLGQREGYWRKGCRVVYGRLPLHFPPYLYK